MNIIRNVTANATGAVMMAVIVILTTNQALASENAHHALIKVQEAFLHARSWHVTEHFSNGKTVTVDYSAPDRWRIKPSQNVTELLIGNSVYMVSNGHTTRLPFGGFMVRKMITSVAFSARKDVQQPRDLGTRTLNGQRVHVYTYLTRGTPVTLYVANGLPFESVVKNGDSTTTIVYSKYNARISIAAP